MNFPCANAITGDCNQQTANLSSANQDGEFLGNFNLCNYVGIGFSVLYRAPSIGPWTWVVTGGAPGIAVQTDTPYSGAVELSGIFTVAGKYKVVIAATDSFGNTFSGTITFNVLPTPTSFTSQFCIFFFDPASAPNGPIGGNYQYLCPDGSVQTFSVPIGATLVQFEALLQAASAKCPGGGGNTTIYFSGAKTGKFSCPDGQQYTFTLRAGAVVGLNAFLVNQQAQKQANKLAQGEAVCISCISDASTGLCLDSSGDITTGTNYDLVVIASGSPLAQFPNSDLYEIDTFDVSPGPGQSAGIPPGMTFNGGFVEGPTRDVSLTGTPTETGTYVFAVKVTSFSPGDYFSSYWWKSFEITVGNKPGCASVKGEHTTTLTYNQNLTDPLNLWENGSYGPNTFSCMNRVSWIANKGEQPWFGSYATHNGPRIDHGEQLVYMEIPVVSYDSGTGIMTFANRGWESGATIGGSMRLMVSQSSGGHLGAVYSITANTTTTITIGGNPNLSPGDKVICYFNTIGNQIFYSETYGVMLQETIPVTDTYYFSAGAYWAVGMTPSDTAQFTWGIACTTGGSTQNINFNSNIVVPITGPNQFTYAIANFPPNTVPKNFIITHVHFVVTFINGAANLQNAGNHWVSGGNGPSVFINIGGPGYDAGAGVQPSGKTNITAVAVSMGFPVSGVDYPDQPTAEASMAGFAATLDLVVGPVGIGYRFWDTQNAAVMASLQDSPYGDNSPGSPNPTYNAAGYITGYVLF